MPLSWSAVHAPRSLRRTLAAHRSGFGDPTTNIGDGEFRRVTLTPEGPGTIRLRWTADPADPTDSGLDAEAWGPGRDWLLGGVESLTGALDQTVQFADAHPVVDRALRTRRTTRFGASHSLYHQLLPTVIAQRITAGEALNQWARLCRALGSTPPGPPSVVAGLVLPPEPSVLRRQPLWWFHPLGIEGHRAATLVECARHADKMWRWSADEAAHKLPLLRGVGPWTVGSVLGPVYGDADAVVVGDYHYPNIVAYALAGEPRADDARMLELLAPYEGQRGRVLRDLVSTAGPAPSFGPRQRILPMSRW
jgi:3-methyladenine DNA glycosylase/8-oxoguanine DNA glycosylase